MKILVLPAFAGKPWNGVTVYEQPLGGSESAVVYLAREFARRGHDLTVVAPGRPGLFDSVTYIQPPEHLDINGYDITLVSRDLRMASMIASGSVRRRLLWLHDMPQQQATLHADRIVLISKFQASAWGLLGHPATAIIGDGVDPTLYAGAEERDPNKLIWASNPDRGLYLAAKKFVEEIHPRWPDLKLYIYGRSAVYGWSDAEERAYLPPREILNHPSIVLCNPLPRLRLARELMTAWAMWYPTFWPETFCMSALEAQAAGCPVITTPEGALSETVIGGIVSYDVVNSISQLRNKGRWKRLSQAGKDHAAKFTWAEVARQWEEEVFPCDGD